MHTYRCSHSPFYGEHGTRCSASQWHASAHCTGLPPWTPAKPDLVSDSPSCPQIHHPPTVASAGLENIVNWTTVTLLVGRSSSFWPHHALWLSFHLKQIWFDKSLFDNKLTVLLQVPNGAGGALNKLRSAQEAAKRGPLVWPDKCSQLANVVCETLTVLA